MGVDGKKNISLRARFVAGANSATDAEAAFQDLNSQLVVEKRDGKWHVSCTEAKQWHGSVDPASTGCTDLRIEVPAGSEQAPLSLDVGLSFGGAHVSGVTVSTLSVTAPFGIVADVQPVHGADIRLYGQDLVSGFCSTALRIPEGVGFDAGSLEVQRPDLAYVGVDPNDPAFVPGVEVSGFSDLPELVPPRTGAWSGARSAPAVRSKSIVLRASLGKAILTTDPVPGYRDMTQCQNIEVVSQLAM